MTRLIAALIFLLITMGVLGCKTVHTRREGSMPVAVWTSIATVDQHGKVHIPEADELVLKVLRTRGVHAVVDEGGISVPEGEDRRAREVLLTDRRLVGSDVIVVIAVPAGSGRKTRRGFEVPEVAPKQGISMPATAPSQ